MNDKYTERYSLPNEITMSEYLFHRMKQLKIYTIFGLPGDYNMALIDKLYKVPNLRWAGNANELNAAYAADGYARIKGISCLLTTFGVGELSSINGIAGSYAEHVGILHIIGMPPSSSQTSKLLLNHTLGNGDCNVFYRMASELASYATIIEDTDFCVQEIDTCIIKAWTLQKPVYLGVPINFVDFMVNSDLLNNNLNFSVTPNDPSTEDDVVETILSYLYKAKKPIIVVDACVTRHHAEKEVEEFCKKTEFQTLVTPMAKGAIDENLPQFSGVYCGSISSPSVREVLDGVDLIIVLGCTLAEFSTSSFHLSYKNKHRILVFPDSIKIKSATYCGLNIKPLMRKLLDKLELTKITQSKNFNSDNFSIPEVQLSSNLLLRQEWVWSKISNWFKEGDIIITETGTSAFGVNQTKFPHNAKGISQSLWGSVGYSLGACLGASFAVSEIKKDEESVEDLVHDVFLPVVKETHRVILFIGDGAFQLTVQELSTIIKWGLTPYIFVMNNHGYSGDRFLHHRSNADYYDIPQWDYLGLLKVFGAKEYESRKIITVGDFQRMVNDPVFCDTDMLRMIEIVLPPMDVPQALMDKWRSDQEANRKKSEHIASDRDTVTPGSAASTSTIQSGISDDSMMFFNY